MAAPSSSASASASLSSSNPSVAVGERLAALEGVMRQLPPSVPIDYHHECVPKGLLKYALADRGHKSGLLQVALSAATTQVFGRPFDGFSEDEVRRAFHLGDKDGVPQSPPRKGGRESLPRPTYRRFFRPQPLSEEEEVALRQKELEEEQRRPPLPPPVVQAQQPLSLPLVQEQQLPPAKRAKAEAAPGAPAVPAVAPAPAAVAVPGLALAVEAPQVDVSQLAGMRRRVSELTQPEVLTIAEEITKKLRAKRTRAWKGNPLETDITRENCAALGIPNYFDVIETPMNLQIIMRKIRASEYAALKEFAADVELMVDNALTFNREGEPVHTFAKETRQLFYKQLAKHKEDYALREDEE